MIEIGDTVFVDWHGRLIEAVVTLVTDTEISII